jgi:hypothetical protein
LPAAARIFRVGRAAVSVSQLARDYSLTTREADALFRATARIGPGSAGARLLEEAKRDVMAGKPVTHPQRLRELDALMRDMGMTEKSTAQAVEHAEVDLDTATRPDVTGGQRPRIADVPVPTKQRRRLDIGDFRLLPGELTQTQALHRIRQVIGKRLSDTPLRSVWQQARTEIVGTRSLENATRQEMFDLYDRVRNRFWDLCKKDPDATRFLQSAGFEFQGGRAPLLQVTATDIPMQERRVSLDHNLEKALGDDYKKAIDVDNFTFEFHNPNSNRETVQVKFGLRTTTPPE